MDVADPAPRVNFDLLRRHMNKKVKLVGEVTDLQNNVATVKAADGGTVHVELVNGPSFEGRFVEFDGFVQSPSQMKEVSRTSHGSSFDLNIYNELCKLSAERYPSLFM